MSTIFSSLPSAAAAPPRLRLMRLMSTSLLVLPLSTLLIMLTDCLEVGVVVLIKAELVAVVAICVAEVPPRRLHCDSTSRDTSGRVGVGAGEVAVVNLRRHPPNICKVAVLPFKVSLGDSALLLVEGTRG